MPVLVGPPINDLKTYTKWDFSSAISETSRIDRLDFFFPSKQSRVRRGPGRFNPLFLFCASQLAIRFYKFSTNTQGAQIMAKRNGRPAERQTGNSEFSRKPDFAWPAIFFTQIKSRDRFE